MTLPRAPRAVIFDLDGTLIDSEALVRDAYFAACPKFGVAISEAQFISLVGMNRDANDGRMRSYFGANFPLDDFYNEVRTHLGECVAPLKPGAAELFDALDELSLPYALATSSARPWVDKHFEAHRLAERFRAVIARGDYVRGKPDPEPYLAAAAALGVEPAFALALEDSTAGVRAAHAAGCMTIMVPDLLTPDDEIRAKALVVTGLDDVRALLGA